MTHDPYKLHRVCHRRGGAPIAASSIYDRSGPKRIAINCLLADLRELGIDRVRG
jgi:hypothetical protein